MWAKHPSWSISLRDLRVISFPIHPLPFFMPVPSKSDCHLSLYIFYLKLSVFSQQILSTAYPSIK